MKAYVCKELKQGTLSNCCIVTDLAKPTPKPSQLLVKTELASINPIDWKVTNGYVDANFPMTSFPFALGFDIMGTVVEVGAEVTKFKVGDKVIADLGLAETAGDNVKEVPNCGAMAQFCVVPEKLAAHTAPELTPEENCALPLAGLTADEALLRRGKLQPNSKVLILGGSSACGMYATFIAKSMKCTVTATCSAKNVETVKGFGADSVIDYTTQAWSEVEAGKDYDLIFDCVGGEKDIMTLYDMSKKVLKKGGKVITICHYGMPEVLSPDYLFEWFILVADGERLALLRDTVVKNGIKPKIHGVFTLDQAEEALKLSQSSRAVGKIIIKIE